MPRARKALSFLLAAVLGCTLAACDDGDPVDPPVLRILAGSELEDMSDILRDAEKALNIKIELSRTGSVEGAKQLADPNVAAQYDAVWFGADQFFGMWPDSRRALLRQSPPLMRSPVVFGVRASLADSLRWSGGRSASWSAIVSAIANGRFRYGMTRPDHSNSGLAGLVAVATAAADTGLPVTADDLPRLQPYLRRFFTGHHLAADTSRVLSDSYVTQVGTGGDECGRKASPEGVDGLVIYESEVRRMSQTLPEACRLTAIYPSEGTIIAEYRLSLLRGATARDQDTFDRLWRWLFTPATQERIRESTSRRPGNPEVTADPATPPVPQLRYPTDPEVLRSLVDRYREQVRPPARMVFVLDVSGSMDTNMPLLRQALIGLTGSDPDDPTTYFSFLAGERVDFVPFNSKAQPAKRFVLPADESTTPTLKAIQAYARTDLRAQGNTAMYDALERAHELVRPGLKAQSTSIVLFSDGQNNCGANYGDYVKFRQKLSPAERSVRIYTIAFDSGEQNSSSCAGYTPDQGPAPGPAGLNGSTNNANESQWERELRVIAEQTRGQLFVPGRDTPLYSIFWSIRGYQ
ncbi:vWA domain-containing protein [Paractinoplanes lichenicola]|uniref:VWA domain-containing protein n=1 Tax=Paractinoplanes lichenicola TaxID=2802976 RepID=A0ABS1VMC8_9ACTN|nr:VWA domain-containing protein [Actinoplanes lichenicola]MBL7255799.1 VWA domain-containing protein [Actinoplanes lichenicola]